MKKLLFTVALGYASFASANNSTLMTESKDYANYISLERSSDQNTYGVQYYYDAETNKWYCTLAGAAATIGAKALGLSGDEANMVGAAVKEACNQLFDGKKEKEEPVAPPVGPVNSDSSLESVGS